MKKTALQQLIEQLKAERHLYMMQEHHPLELAIIEDCFDSAIWKAKELLEKEREQIEKAYYRGKSDYKASRPLKSKQYYKEIYEKELNQNK
jgi:hypothetical protein